MTEEKKYRLRDEDEGRIVWFDLLTKDVEAAKAFYSTVVGWEPFTMQTAFTTLDVWMLETTTIIGQLRPLPEEHEDIGSRWIPYVCVKDVDQWMKKKLAEANAEPLMPVLDIDAIGRVVLFREPNGAVLSVYTPEDQPPSRFGIPLSGDIVWTELVAADPEVPLGFYRSLFDWTDLKVAAHGDFGESQILGHKKIAQAGTIAPMPNSDIKSEWLVHALVDDVEAAVARVTENGGTKLAGPSLHREGRTVAYCRDPQGALFALSSRPPGAPVVS